jgi:hypothetical protein
VTFVVRVAHRCDPHGRTRRVRCSAIQAQPASQYAEPRSSPSSAAWASHAAIQASAVGSVTP